MANVDLFRDWYIKLQQSSSWTLEGSEHEQMKWHDACHGINGWGSPGSLELLNFVVSNCLENDEQYLEVGTYCGRSVCAALQGNRQLAQVVDPFELFLPDGLFIKSLWDKNTITYGVRDRIMLHKSLSDSFSGSLPAIGVYYYDGSHEVGFTYRGLITFEKYLSDNAIIIVDDVSMVEVKPDIERYLSERHGIVEFLGNTPFGPHNQAVMIFSK